LLHKIAQKPIASARTLSISQEVLLQELDLPKNSEPIKILTSVILDA